VSAGSRYLATAFLVILAVSPAAAQAPRGDGSSATPSSSRALLDEGDAHYARRQEGHVGATADPGQVLAAIASYEAASRAPDDAESRWKLARALYFRGTYTALGPGERKTAYDEARHVSDEAIAIVSRRAGLPGNGFPPASAASALRSEANAAPAFFWGAVAWGQWALSVGKLEAARMGAASEIRDAAQFLIALDPEFEEGGGYRILGRLHDEAPRIPFLTWWVSREQALTNLRRAVAVAPRNPVNLHFLAEALFRGSSSEKEEAIRLENRVLATPSSPTHLVEELHVQDEARRNLAQWGK
jgi:tetratricopeptide (TPR) repeat protein